MAKTGKKDRIVIHVSGGCVTCVMGTRKIPVEVFDVDNMEQDPELLSEDGESPILTNFGKIP